MSEMNINELTDEALLAVFAFLDESSIINAMDVCERWDELITAKTTLHAKFSLDLSSNSRHYENFKYQKLKAMSIESETDIDKRQMEIFHRNKETIKEAEISFSTWSIFEKDLMDMTNLVKLSLYNIEYTHSSIKTSMHSLKELKIDRRPVFLDVPNLVKLNYTGPRLPTEFLETCEKLTHLTYKMYSDDDEVSTELSAISPHLTFLKVSVAEETSLIPLLESQKTSLRELEMSGNKYEDVEYAINQMRLEKLNIRVPHDLKTLSNNSSIKELSLYYFGPHYILQAIRKILASCTSTEKLIIDLQSPFNQAAVMLAVILPNLKHLVISRKYVDVQTAHPPLNYIRTFDSIESLHLTLECDSNIDAYLRLLANCPNLKKLKVDWVFDMSEKIVEPIISKELQTILDTVPDLEEIIADRVFMLSENVIETLQKSKIRILKFTVYEDVFEEQQKLAIQLSKQSDIRCTVFSVKKFSLSAVISVFNKLILDFVEDDGEFDPEDFNIH